MKKSQIQSQIFIYIMVLVIGAGILIYGYKAVKSFQGQADNTLVYNFENQFRNDLKGISYEAKSIKNYELPIKYSQVCFKGRDLLENDVGGQVSAEESLQSNRGYKYPLIQAALGSSTDRNVFLYPAGDYGFNSAVEVDFVDKDTLQQEQVVQGAVSTLSNIKSFKCFDVNRGRLSIRLIGKGSYVSLAQVN
jgi:hypothetical protein